MALFVRTMQIDIPNQVKKTVSDRSAGIVYKRPTILGALLDAESSAEDKEPRRISDEALAVVGAGVSAISPSLKSSSHWLNKMPLHSPTTDTGLETDRNNKLGPSRHHLPLTHPA